MPRPRNSDTLSRFNQKEWLGTVEKAAARCPVGIGQRRPCPHFGMLPPGGAIPHSQHGHRRSHCSKSGRVGPARRIRFCRGTFGRTRRDCRPRRLGYAHNPCGARFEDFPGGPVYRPGTDHWAGQRQISRSDWLEHGRQEQLKLDAIVELQPELDDIRREKTAAYEHYVALVREYLAGRVSD